MKFDLKWSIAHQKNLWSLTEIFCLFVCLFQQRLLFQKKIHMNTDASMVTGGQCCAFSAQNASLNWFANGNVMWFSRKLLVKNVAGSPKEGETEFKGPFFASIWGKRTANTVYVNSCFLMSSWITHFSYTSCDVTGYITKPWVDPYAYYCSNYAYY